MSTKDTKFVRKELWELSELSEPELRKYVDQLQEEADRIEAKTLKLREQAIEDALRTAFMEGQIHELDKRNAELAKSHGWEGITQDELHWLMEGGLDEHWPKGIYFKRTLPTLREVREKYHEEMGAAKRDFTELEKKLVQPSAWVSRSGKYFPVGFAKHDEFAREFLIEKYGEEKAYEYRKTDSGKMPFFEVLEKKFKWVRIMAWPGIPTEFVLPRDLTHSQKQTLYKYCQFHLKKLPFEDPLFED